MKQKTTHTVAHAVPRGILLPALALLALALQPGAARAQWTQPATTSDNISNTNTNGNVGVGTTNPNYRFVVGPSMQAGMIFATMTVSKGAGQSASIVVGAGGPSVMEFGWDNPNGRAFLNAPGSTPIALTQDGSNVRLFVAPGGNVGVGTGAAAPIARLQVRRDHPNTTFQNGPDFQLFVQNLNTAANNTVGFAFGGQRADGTSRLAGSVFAQMTSHDNGSFASDLVFNVTGPGETPLEGLRIKSSGNVGLGTASPSQRLEVVGGIKVSKTAGGTGGDLSVEGAITGGSISATYQDVAEWVPSVQKLQAGTVVILDSGRTNHVLASAGAYDTKVAGVVSARPGVILGVAGEGKLMVATTGRVKVKADASRGAIRIGDLIVTSDVEGVAMRSEPVAIGGRQFHAPGTIIGKALEPLEKGTGEILVLLSLQ